MVSEKHCGGGSGKHHRNHAQRRRSFMPRAHEFGNTMGNTDQRSSCWQERTRKPGDAAMAM